jgi:hypothetical protein
MLAGELQDEVKLAWTDIPALRGLKGQSIARSEMYRAQARALADVLLETGEAAPNPRAQANDPVRLRGVPIIGRGVAGAIRGSRPTDALAKLIER